MKSVLVLCLFTLLGAKPAMAEEGLVIHNVPQYGFLFKYPKGWDFYHNRPRGVATATSPNGIGKFTVRIERFLYRGFRDGENLFIEKYKRRTAAESSRFPSSHYHSFEDSISTYEFRVETKKDLVDYEYKYRVLIFPDPEVTIALESVCAPERSRVDCALLERSLRTFWVYNKEKFSQMYRSRLETDSDVRPDKKDFKLEPFGLDGR